MIRIAAFILISSIFGCSDDSSSSKSNNNIGDMAADASTQGDMGTDLSGAGDMSESPRPTFPIHFGNFATAVIERASSDVLGNIYFAINAAGVIETGQDVFGDKARALTIISMTPEGVLRWAEEFSTDSVVYHLGQTSAPSGDFYLAVDFGGPMDIRGTAFEPGHYLFAFTTDGAIKWTKPLPDGLPGQGCDIAANDQNQIRLLCPLSDPFDFGSGELNADGSQSLAYVVLDEAGVEVSSKEYPGIRDGGMLNLDVVAAGQSLCFTAAVNEMNIDFGDGPITSKSFVGCLDRDGNHVWSSPSLPEQRIITLSGRPDLFFISVLPDYSLTFMINGNPVETVKNEAVLIALTTTGGVRWARSLSRFRGVEPDGDGGVYYSATVSPGAGEPSVPEIGHLDASGETIWKRAATRVGSPFVAQSGLRLLYDGPDIELRKLSLMGVDEGELWSSSVNTPSYQRVNDITGDGSGRFLVVADFFNKIQVQDLSSSGRNSAIGTVSFDADGQVSHMVGYSSDSDEYVESAAAVGDKVVIAGRIRSRLTLGNASITSASGYEAFIALTDYAGNVDWAVDFGKDANDVFKDVAVSPDGQTIYAVGSYGDRVVNFNVPHVGIASYGTDGTLNWSTEIAGLDVAIANRAAANSLGVYIAGQFKGGSPWDGQRVESDSATFIVAHTSADRTSSWTLLGAGLGRGHAIAVDETGNSVVSASVSQEMEFCGTQITAPAHIVFGVDPQGTCQWVQSYQNIIIDRLEYTSSGQLWGVGNYAADQMLAGTQLVNQGRTDALVVRLNPSDGQIDRAHGFGGPGDDTASGIHIDDNGIAYVSGFFGGRAMIGFGDDALELSGDDADGFVIRFDSTR